MMAVPACSVESCPPRSLVVSAGIVVADDGFEFYFDTELIEFLGQPETVGVSAIGRE